MSIEEEIIRDIRSLEDTERLTAGIRKNLLTKLDGIVTSMNLNPDEEKAGVILAKTALVDSLLKTAESINNSQERIIKLKQKVKSSEDKEDANAMIAKTIGTFLSKLENKNPSFEGGKIVTSVDETIDNVVEELGIEISEGELEVDKPTVEI